MAKRKERSIVQVGGEKAADKRSHNWIPPAEWMEPLKGLPNDELTTVAQAAAQLEISTNQVYYRMRTGKLPCIKIGKIYLIRKADVETWQPLPRGFPPYIRRRKPRAPKPGAWLLR